MLAVIQRVRHARVVVDAQEVGAIGPGLLVLLCAEQARANGANLLRIHHHPRVSHALNHSQHNFSKSRVLPLLCPARLNHHPTSKPARAAPRR